MKKKILCFVDWYLPGYRAGGPIQSIANLVDNLGDEFNIYIFCKDRDFSDKEHYKNVSIDQWNKVGKANVFYASKKSTNINGLIKILSETNYDIIYLNSFFSIKFTILPLLICKFLIFTKKPIIISPKGNLSIEALKIKKFKKKIYIKFFKFFKLYNHLNWHVSSQYEKKDVANLFENKIKKISVVPDFAPSSINLRLTKKNLLKPRKVGPLRILFFSRISQIKNLDFFIKVLIDIDFPIEFSIYGPKEDFDYWKKCCYLIKKIPPYIKIKIGDAIPQNKITSIFFENDLLVLPTKGEAFGNVIIESLSAGLPALISNKTLWKSDSKGGLEILNLEEGLWLERIKKWGKLNDKMLKYKRQSALNYAIKYYNDDRTIIGYKDLFYSVIR